MFTPVRYTVSRHPKYLFSEFYVRRLRGRGSANYRIYSEDISSTDTTDFSIAARADAVDRGIASTTRKRGGRGANVEVHIDIDYDDYTFTSQPGALKRIILNVFGNALKYTQKGSIIVKLSLERTIESNNKPTDERVLELNIVDTGKGISSEYLRTSLFNRGYPIFNIICYWY